MLLAGLAEATAVVEAPTVSAAAISPAAAEGIEMPLAEVLAAPVGITGPARDPVEAVALPAWDHPEAVEEAAVGVAVVGAEDSLRSTLMPRVSRTRR